MKIHELEEKLKELGESADYCQWLNHGQLLLNVARTGKAYLNAVRGDGAVDVLRKLDQFKAAIKELEK